MAINDAEKARLRVLSEIERLKSDGLEALRTGNGDADGIADKLLEISQTTGDAQIRNLASSANAAIITGQFAAAASAMSGMADEMAAATKTFQSAAAIAAEGEADLTFPFIAGKAASLLDLAETLKDTVEKTIAQAGGIDGAGEVIAALDAARTSLKTLREKAEAVIV